MSKFTGQKSISLKNYTVNKNNDSKVENDKINNNILITNC